MEKRGLAFDYDANRNRRVIARAPNGAAGDYEALRGRIPGMTPDGRPMEIDPATMKKLQEAMRGMQPGPGGLPPGPAMRPGGPNVPSGLVTGDTSRRLLQQRGRGLPPGYAPGDTTRPHRPAGALPSQKLRRNIP
ncbi:MAG TPA: hypothetical protein PLG50_14750 [bacterium]|mgnify:FL=1|nr:hypothetical protein [bacterium]